MKSAKPCILTINGGSSSIKFALFPHTGGGPEMPQQAMLSGLVDGIGAETRFTAKDAAGERIAYFAMPDAVGEHAHHAALKTLLDWLTGNDGGARMVAIGHRVVHGGERYSAPVRLDDAMIEALAGFIPLAPLPQPHNLDAIRTIAKLRPELPQVACFDTAFHRSQPEIAQVFALQKSRNIGDVRGKVDR